MLDEGYDMICGSRLDANPGEMSNKILNFSEHVKGLLSSKKQSVIQKHNLYTAYCVMLLAYGTGHRPVTDMFCFREDIDLEQNILIVNDKVSSSANENRVCWFSDVTNTQIDAYFNHLKSLASFIYTEVNNNDLATIINSLPNIAPAHKQPLPLFFFLEQTYEIVSLTPATLTKQLKNLWPYELNHNRHFLETYLYNHGLHRLLIDLQLGHQQVHNHLLGSNTSWTAYECGEIIKTALNHLSKQIIWPVINGLTYKSVPITKNQRYLPKNKYGHLLRREIRHENIIKLEAEIKDILLGELANAGGIDKYLSNDKLQYDSISRILVECRESEHLSQKAVSLFIDMLNKKAREANSRQIKSIQVTEGEPSPFMDCWLSKYVAGRQARERFVSYIIDKEINKNTLNLELMWAEIVASSVLIGGLFKSQWAAYLLEHGPDKIHKIKNWIYFINIWCHDPEKNIERELQSPDWRWQPDSFTRNLLHQLLKRHNKTAIGKYSPNKAFEFFDHITYSLGISPTRKTNSVQVLCTHIESFWIYHFPSYIRDIFLSKNKSIPLPQRSLARLCYGKKLSANIQSSNEPQDIYLPDYKPDKKKNIKEYLFLVRAAINNASSNHKASRSKQLDNLRELILELHSRNLFPSVAMALSQWLLHITIHGTARIDKPSISTIDKYFFSIAEPLSIYIGIDNTLDISDEIITEIYKNVIEYNGKQQKTRASQIFRFNQIITGYGLAEFNELDWSYIAGKWLSSKETHVDANIITPEEYLQSLNIINNSKMDSYTKNWMGIFIVIGYRFGLRISEIHRLRAQDIQRHKKDIIIQVLNTREGRTKSKSAVRQVPLLGELNVIEASFIDTHIDMVRHRPDFNIKSPLFIDPLYCNELLDRQIIWREIHTLLRHVIGDKRIRFHHLRHSYITGQFIGNFQKHAFRIPNELNGNLWADYHETISTTLIKHEFSSAYLLASLSTCAGHSRQSTSMASYIHLADDVANGYADIAPFPEISLDNLSKITGYSEYTLKNRMRKKGLNKEVYSGIKILRTIQIGDLITPYDFKFEKWPRTAPLASKKHISTLADMDDILRYVGLYNTPINMVAYNKSLEPKEVSNLIERARHLADFTGYFKFGITGNHNDFWFNIDNTNAITSFNKEKKNINLLLNTLDIELKYSKTRICLERATDCWLDTIQMHDSGNVLIFKKPSQLKDFLMGCELMGYKSTNFRYAYSKILDNNKKNQIITALEKLGINDVVSDKTRRLSNGSLQNRLNFIKLTVKKEKLPQQLPKNTSSLSRVFFLLSLKFEKTFI